jgi:hypothetical protein
MEIWVSGVGLGRRWFATASGWVWVLADISKSITFILLSNYEHKTNGPAKSKTDLHGDR